jgi:flagellar biosynthesis/type III secretory pathway protein FliH
MMRLPEELEQQLWQEIEILEENEKMQYVTSVERMGIAKGRQEGLQEGQQKGLLEGEAEMLGLMLKHRFGELSDAVVNRLRHASEDQLKEWLISAISAPNLDAVFNDGTTH